ncbi:MAG: hypothetical protein NVS4B6_22600 [Mycobacterium sp.]
MPVTGDDCPLDRGRAWAGGDGRHAAVAQWLLARDVPGDYRPAVGIRVAAHFSTSDQELDDAIVAIDDCLLTGVTANLPVGRA